MGCPLERVVSSEGVLMSTTSSEEFNDEIDEAEKLTTRVNPNPNFYNLNLML